MGPGPLRGPESGPGAPGSPSQGPRRPLRDLRGGCFYINPSRRGPVPVPGPGGSLPGPGSGSPSGGVWGAPALYKGGGTPRRAAGGFARRAVRYGKSTYVKVLLLLVTMILDLSPSV